MALQLTHDTDEILYNGKVVGKHSFKDGKHTVSLSIEYETEGDWFTPLSWFASELAKLEGNKPKPAELEISLNEGDVDDVAGAQVLLTEVTIKSKGYVWRFHKSDADNWPSSLHAHDYEKGLKLDAVTGKIYDAFTRNHCKTVNAKKLKTIQEQLCASTDFKAKAKDILPDCKN